MTRTNVAAAWLQWCPDIRSAFGKLHITRHKLPHNLAIHVYQYVHGKATHRHARRRIMFARLLQGKVESPSSVAALHNSLAAPITASL